MNPIIVISSERDAAFEEKRDALVAAIRSLARSHGVAHRVFVNDAVKLLKRIQSETSLALQWPRILNDAGDGGVPIDELRAVYTMLFQS